ncbi:MAG TPA: MarC family protein [Xanthobacteraceae bacterium]|nr:MarC family protein [Xanthobacteraceae bacterium]
MWQERLSEFVTLFVVLNPIAAIPVFLATASGLEAPQQRKVALQAVLVSLGVLLFFIFAGGFLLKHMGIAMRAFQIAGGIVLFMFAVTMVIGHMVPQATSGDDKQSTFARAVYPLAIPKIAGPGAMLTVMLLTDDDRFSMLEKTMTVGVLVLVLAIQLAVLLLAVPIARFLGEGGANVISRVFGMLLAALAVNIVITTLADWLGLPKL